MSDLMVLRSLERELLVYRRLFRGSLFTTFGVPILFLAAMGLGLGGLVDERTGPVDGLDYLTFIAPGVMAAGAMQSAAAESLWPVMAGLKWIGSYKATISTPVSAADIYAGRVLFTAVRATVSSTAFLLVAWLFGGVPSPWGLLALPAAVLCAVAFAAPITAFTATQDTDIGFPLIIRLGVMPLFLFSGTFFPVDQLPDALEPLALASPLWHGVELCRAATTGEVEFLPAVGHVLVLGFFVLIGVLWGTRTFPRRLTP